MPNSLNNQYLLPRFAFINQIILLIFCLGLFTPLIQAAPPPEAFGELPRVGDAAISPDAKHIAAFVNIDGSYQVAILPMNDNNDEIKQVGLGKGVKPIWVKWANNHRVLIAIWQSNKYRGTPITSGYIYTFDTKTEKGRILVKPPKDVLRQFNHDVIDFLEADPDHILMSFSNNDVFAPGIQRVKVASGRSKLLKHGSPNIQSWYTDRRGEPRIGQGISDRSHKEAKWTLTIRDADGDTWRDSKHYPGLDKDVDIHGFTSDPNELIIGIRNGKSTTGLYIYDLEKKKQTRKLFHDDEFDVSNVVLSADGKDVIGVTYEADTTETKLFEEYEGSLQRLRSKLPGYVVDYVDSSRDYEWVLVRVSSPYDPGSLMILNTRTEALEQLSQLRPSLPVEQMGEVVSFRYTARDGFKIPAYITLPPKVMETQNIENLPFIIMPHGGPYARDTKRFDYFAQFFASRGFGVLQMNFRGSAGYGQAFEDAGRKNWVLMQDDVEDGTRFLIEKGYADPNRICIVGWSYGGYAALMGAIKNPELYACAASMAGVTDLHDMINDMKKYRFGRLNSRNFILNGFENRDAIKENSPIKRASELTVPLFLAHGELDQRVHFDQFKRMKRALKKSSAKTTFMEFEDEDHFLSSQSNRQKFFRGLDRFLKETVGESEFVD